jgi:hypothetical protein
MAKINPLNLLEAVFPPTQTLHLRFRCWPKSTLRTLKAATRSLRRRLLRGPLLPRGSQPLGQSPRFISAPCSRTHHKIAKVLGLPLYLHWRFCPPLRLLHRRCHLSLRGEEAAFVHQVSYAKLEAHQRTNDSWGQKRSGYIRRSETGRWITEDVTAIVNRRSARATPVKITPMYIKI